MEILWFSLLFGSVACQYQIQPINNTVGVYYHENGNIIVTNDEWTILVNKDISAFEKAYENNNRILDSLIDTIKFPGHSMSTFQSEVKTHVSLLTQISKSIQIKLVEIKLDTKRYKRGLINGIGSIFKSITGNLDAADGEYYLNCINRLNNDEHQLENLLKNQISVTTSVIQNFNTTIQKMQVDEETFNNDIKEIENAINELNDRITRVEAKLKFFDVCEKLMESFLFLEENINDMLESITFARLNIIHSSIITPDNLVAALQEISLNLQRSNLPLQPKLSKIAQYLEIIELKAFQTKSNLVFILKIPLTEPKIYTLYHLYPIPIYDNRTGLHHILSINQKFIAKDDDSLMFIPVTDTRTCKPLLPGTELCSDMFAYPIDSNAICEAQILKSSKQIPRNCQSSLIFSQGYNVQRLQNNLWLIITAEPLQVTINCPNRNIRSEMIYINSVLKLQNECSAFIGITKVQANSQFSKTLNVSYNTHPVVIPYECCNDIPDRFNLPKLKPLKLSDLNVDDLNIAQHKLDSYSKTLDDLINEPFVTKNISWFTYFTITIIVCLAALYIFCKCRKRKHRLAITGRDSPPSPPPRPSKPFKRIPSIFCRRRPSIRGELDEEAIELDGVA